MTTRIRRFVETDTGHRVPNHKSKCRHMHGHRYRFEAEIEGDTVQTSGVSDEGMLMDFSDVSSILMEHVHDVIDHAFVVYEGDKLAREACERMVLNTERSLCRLYQLQKIWQNGLLTKSNRT